MKILGIDTSTRFLCLGIYDNAKIYEYNLKLETKQSSLLVPTIKRVIEAMGWHLSDIDYFACGLGPGSFTGLRVGLATIKGLAWSLRKPIIGISTLDILARNINLTTGAVSSHSRIWRRAKNVNTFVAPVIDAKRDLIYASIYKLRNGSLERLAPYMLLGIEELLRRVKNNTILLGNAVGLYREKILSSLKRIEVLDEDYWLLQPRNIVELSLEMIKKKKISNPFDIKPFYLYPKECQIKNSN